MRYFRILLIVLSVSVLSACNSGSSSSENGGDPPSSISDFSGEWFTAGIKSTGEGPSLVSGYTVINDEGEAVLTTVPDRATGETPVYSLSFHDDFSTVFTSEDLAYYFSVLDKSGKSLLPFSAYNNGYMSGLDVRLGTSYNLADLAGAWSLISMSTDYNWRLAGTMIISGNLYTFIGIDNEDTFLNFSDTLNINSDGVVTLDGYATFTGALDAGKTVIAAVSGDDPFKASTEKAVYLLKAPSSVDGSDFAGKWSHVYTYLKGDHEFRMFYGETTVGYGYDSSACAADAHKSLVICMYDEYLEFRTKGH
jgi:hypothetical protein